MKSSTLGGNSRTTNSERAHGCVALCLGHPCLARLIGFLVCALLLLAHSSGAFAQQNTAGARWSAEKARAWYAQQPWPVGANFLPSDAINQLEMWQKESFDAAEIDRELGWAEAMGMNTVRVFLHNLVWEEDPVGFAGRIDQFLALAAKHRIRPIFVLFDSCWDPHPKLGPQHPPIPGVHNSGWTQAPGADVLMDKAKRAALKNYVQGVLKRFGKDDRILAWDLWNEPDNLNESSYKAVEIPNKVTLVLELLPQVFAWARAENPSQPLTSGVWQGDWTAPENMSAMTRLQLDESDIVSFHDYGWPEQFERRISELSRLHRPILCTEYMARGAGSTFDTILPIAKAHRVGAVNWGFVKGRSQTYLPWDSWQRPYVVEAPTVWFHDILYEDGRPYRAREVELFQALTGKTQGDKAQSGQSFPGDR